MLPEHLKHVHSLEADMLISCHVKPSFRLPVRFTNTLACLDIYCLSLPEGNPPRWLNHYESIWITLNHRPSIYLGKFHHDRTLFSRTLESWVISGKSSPFMAARFRLENYYSSRWFTQIYYPYIIHTLLSQPPNIGNIGIYSNLPLIFLLKPGGHRGFRVVFSWHQVLGQAAGSTRTTRCGWTPQIWGKSVAKSTENLRKSMENLRKSMENGTSKELYGNLTLWGNSHIVRIYISWMCSTMYLKKNWGLITRDLLIIYPDQDGHETAGVWWSPQIPIVACDSKRILASKNHEGSSHPIYVW